MMVFVLSVLAATLSPPDAPVTEVALENVSPLWAIEMLGSARSEQGVLGGDWIPDGVKVEADLERNTIVLTGPRKDVRSALKAIRAVDVAPPQVDIDARIENSVIGRAWRTSTTLCSDQPLIISEETSGLKVEFRARRRDDDTYDIWIENGRAGIVTKFRMRAKPGETFVYQEGRVVSVYDRDINFDRRLPRDIDGLGVTLYSQEGAFPAGQRIAFQLRRVRSSA